MQAYTELTLVNFLFIIKFLKIIRIKGIVEYLPELNFNNLIV